MTPDGLYIHIPYCYDKCTYCDFNSAPIAGADVGRYRAALKKEISALPDGFAPKTVFFGGGTPTALPTGPLADLLRHLASHVDLTAVTEYSVEANPGTVTPEKLATLREHGVNRLSIGAQTFDNAQLKQLGRIHDASQVGATVRAARAAGFANLSLDLIFALPEQTLPEWLDTLHQALALGPEHLSAYCLTYEEGTELTRSNAKRSDEETELAMLRATVKTLEKHDYPRYEISNYARPGSACAHNLTYWRNEPYYGLGAGAASYIDGRRYRNVENPAHYCEQIETTGIAVDFEETLDPAAARRERVAIGLRLCDGIELSEADAAELYDGEVPALCSSGLLTREGDWIRLTEQGLELADSVMARLV